MNPVEFRAHLKLTKNLKMYSYRFQLDEQKIKSGLVLRVGRINNVK